MAFLTVPLSSSHKKESFNCGKALLDNYLHKQAKQDVKRMLSACFVLPDDENNVKGYYTLSSSSIGRNLLPDEIVKRLPPSYQDLPVILLGRLAVNQNYQGQGIGETLLIDALKKSYSVSAEVGAMAVLVDPLDNNAVRFYEKYEFITLPDSAKMFLPMSTIAKLFAGE